VDIGFHYVALTNSVPYDSDGDGIPDYIEDRTNNICGCLAPSVTLTNPVNGQLFVTSLTNIVMDATASDPDGWILYVDFYNGTNKLGTVYNAPYEFVWPNVSAGTYTLSAKATDDTLLSSTSTGVSITVNALPSVQICSPTNSQSFVAPASVPLKAWATDSDGSITNIAVQFFQGTNTTAIGTGTLSGTNFVYNNWTNVGPGGYALYAKATDNRGGVRLSDLVDFTVYSTNDYPLISINSPANGSSFKAWSDVTITASASDASGISRVDFFSGTNFLGSDTTAAAGTNYSITVRGLKPGQYTFRAKATDNSTPAGRNLSAPVSVTVNLPEPTGNGFWDPVFGSLNDDGFNPVVNEFALTIDPDANVYSGLADQQEGGALRVKKWAN